MICEIPLLVFTPKQIVENSNCVRHLVGKCSIEKYWGSLIAIHYAHAMNRQLAEVHKNGALPYLRPDGK